MKIWAVGLKQWVQLRESKTPPIPHSSHARKPTMEKISLPIYTASGQYTGKIETKEVKKDLVFKIVSFSGGDVKATIKRRTFTERTGIAVPEGQVKEIPPQVANPLIADDWSQKIPQDLGGGAR